jgi:hypothetical protein
MKKYTANVIGVLTGGAISLGFFESRGDAMKYAEGMVKRNSDVYLSPFVEGPFLVME